MSASATLKEKTTKRALLALNVWAAGKLKRRHDRGITALELLDLRWVFVTLGTEASAKIGGN